MLFSVCQFLFGERQVNGLRLAQRDCKWGVCIYFFTQSFFDHFENYYFCYICIEGPGIQWKKKLSLKIYAVTGDNSASIYM